jgi:hypothetical protein
VNHAAGTFLASGLSKIRDETLNIRQIGAAIAVLLQISCAVRRDVAQNGLGSFQVVRATPQYLLRAPDATSTAFPELLNRYRNLGIGWVDLRPQMELRVEAAYYREGSLKRSLADYLGTETARFQVRPNGQLRLTSVQSSLKGPRGKQPPVQQLVRGSQRRYSHGRFFYAVAMNRNGQTRSAVLLGAGTTAEVARLTTQLLSDPQSVCGGKSTHCTVFPEASSASLDIEIVVNGSRRSVAWGNVLDSIAVHPRHVEMLRVDAGRLVPVEIDASDPAALKLPLLPGDRVTWE